MPWVHRVEVVEPEGAQHVRMSPGTIAVTAGGITTSLVQ